MRATKEGIARAAACSNTTSHCECASSSQDSTPFGPQCRIIKKYLIWKFGEQCSRCGWAERHPKTGKVPVEVEHIDGNFANNVLTNLVLLCPNCHSLTDTYRGLNRGKGRAERLGGRQNPLRGGMPRGKKLVEPLTSFPLARSLAELVEAKLPSRTD